MIRLTLASFIVFHIGVCPALGAAVAFIVIVRSR